MRVRCSICLELLRITVIWNFLSFLCLKIIKNSSGKCDSYTRTLQMNQPDDWLKTGWARNSQTRTRLVDSLICITCSLENNAFSILHYVIKVTLHYLMLHRFEIHSVLELSRAALLGCRLAASRLREAQWSLVITNWNQILQYTLKTMD